jgi:hypothetical protein
VHLNLKSWRSGVIAGVVCAAAFASRSHYTQGFAQSASPSSETFETFNTRVLEPLSQSAFDVLTGNVQRPNGIAWFNNKLYTACTGDQTIYEIDSVTGSTATYIFGITNAHTLVVEGETGNQVTLWVPDYGDNTFERVTRGGVERIADDLQGPWGIAALDDETFMITELLGNRVSVLDREGTQRVVMEAMAGPAGLALDDAYAYIANNGSTRRAIEWYPRESLAEGTFAGETGEQVLVRGLQNTAGLVLGPDGYLYFTYALGTRGVIGRIQPGPCREQGGCTNDQVEIVAYTELATPLAGLVVTPDMRLFVHTMFSPDIYWTQLPVDM